MSLTNLQFEVIVGTLLGDGRLDKPSNGNARLQVRHSIKQLEYVVFKRELLGSLSGRLFY